MSECTCHKNYTLDTLIPKVGVITDIRQETPDVKTFRVEAPEGGKLFEHMPGQCAMVCAPGVSEGMFSITSSPTVKDYQEFSIKKCGSLTDHLHSLQVGDEIAVRGPYGNHFPVEDKLKGKNLLFIAGGIGLAPLRSVINYVLDNREDYGTVDILYGSRSADDLVQLKAIQEEMKKEGTDHVWLSMENIDKDTILHHFPHIYERCLEEGYDVTKECIPVVPAQHYFMGGIWVDADSKTSMDQLYAVGETSCNGVHGANRLASNSLLESLVFAKRAAKAISAEKKSEKSAAGAA